MAMDAAAVVQHGPQADETALVAAWVARDPQARDAAYRWLWPKLTALLSDFGHCLSDVEDLAQDAFARIEETLPTFDPSRRLWPWARVVARHHAINQYVKQRDRVGRPRLVYDPALVHHAAPTVADHAEGVVVREGLRKALAEIPPRQRTALLASAAGLSSEEAGQLLGVDAAALRQLSRRARLALRGHPGLAHSMWAAPVQLSIPVILDTRSG